MSRAGSLVWTERWKRIGIGISPFRSILHLKHIGSFVHMGCDSSAFIIPARGNAKENNFHEVRFITHGPQAGIGVLVTVRLIFHHQFRVRAEKSICGGSLFLFLHA